MELNAQQANTLAQAATLIDDLQAELEDRIIGLVREFEERTHLKVIGITLQRFDDDSEPCRVQFDAITRECR